MFHIADPVLRPCAVEALQGGRANPSGLPAASAAQQANKQTEIPKKITASEPTHMDKRLLKGFRKCICHWKKEKNTDSNQN